MTPTVRYDGFVCVCFFLVNAREVTKGDSSAGRHGDLTRNISSRKITFGCCSRAANVSGDIDAGSTESTEGDDELLVPLLLLLLLPGVDVHTAQRIVGCIFSVLWDVLRSLVRV